MSDLIIYPQDLTLFLRIILIPFLFEFFRIVIGSLYLFTSLLFLPIPSASLGYFFVGQSSKVNQLEKEKLEIQFELAQIKSIQLELVRHSKLERKMIKIDKEIEGLKANQIPKEKKFKSSVNIARGVIYLLSGIYFSSAPLVLISPQVIIDPCPILSFLTFPFNKKRFFGRSDGSFSPPMRLSLYMLGLSFFSGRHPSGISFVVACC